MSNRNGLGATVRVRSAGQTYTKYNDGKSGYLAQSVLPLYFGLGEATKIDRVEVDWPSGQKQVLTTGLEENQTLQITEPTVNSRTEPQSLADPRFTVPRMSQSMMHAMVNQPEGRHVSL